MEDNRTILLIDDDRVDILTVKRAMRDIGVKNPLDVANNGEEGLDYLTNPAHPRPGIILLDINMPKMNGIEFLQEREKNISLKMIPVIVLTSSDEDQDRLATYQHSIAGYMVKPVDYNQFVEMMKKINGYWSVSKLAD